MHTSAQRRRQLFVILLTVNSGATDAIGFLALGGAFTSVMTGNLVLFGLSLARADWSLTGRTAAAIICYIAGCAVGTRIAGTPRADQAVWPRRVTLALVTEAVIYVGYAIGWWVTGSAPATAVQLVLLSVTAVALGIQSTAVQRFGVSGLSTTYMTGTLTMLVHRLASGHRLRDVFGALGTLLALIGGAVAAAALVEHARSATPLVQLVALGVACAGGWFWSAVRPAMAAPEPEHA